MMNIKKNFLLLIIFIFSMQFAFSGNAIALKINSSSDLLSGYNTHGQIGDYKLVNNKIAIIISDIPHNVSYSETGGNVIDAASVFSPTDELDLVYLYLNDDWPRQASYTSIEILDNGSTSDSAAILVSGVDNENSNIGITTKYILHSNSTLLKLKTTFTNNSQNNLNSYGVGDAFTWGSCSIFVPPYGYSADYTTYSSWIAATGSINSYGYFGREGEFETEHGSDWSDATLETINLQPSESYSFTRFFVITDSHLSSISDLVLNYHNLSSGSVSGLVSNNDGAVSSAEINFIQNDTDIFTQGKSNQAGKFLVNLPVGSWKLETIKAGYDKIISSVEITEDDTAGIIILLEEASIPPSGDTITIVQQPLPNIPVIHVPGDTIEICCLVSEDFQSWSSSLIFNDKEIEMTSIDRSFDQETGLWTLRAVLPEKILYELWDLRVNIEYYGIDDVKNAVKIIPEYKENFYFIQVTDTHLPTNLYWEQAGSEQDTSEIEDLREVIRDINLINPEFVLLTGDLIHEGELEDFQYRRYFTRALRILTEFEVPVFLTSGNHDIGGWDQTPPPDGTARKSWWNFFGWKRLGDFSESNNVHTQDYTFDYGNCHFIGMEAYDNYDSWMSTVYGQSSFTNTQLTWLNDNLEQLDDSTLKILFYHYDFKEQIDLSALGVDLALWGHTHSNIGSIDQYPYNLCTAATCGGRRAYRMVRIEGNQIFPCETQEAGTGIDNLSVEYIHSDNFSKAIVTNKFANHFEHFLLKMDIGAKSIESVQNGELFQIDSSSTNNIAYIRTNIGANSTKEITLNLKSTKIETLGRNRQFKLSQNYPNPFNGNTIIPFNLKNKSDVTVKIFDIKGKTIFIKKMSNLNPGEYKINYNNIESGSEKISSGIYFYSLSTNEYSETRKMLYLQ